MKKHQSKLEDIRVYSFITSLNTEVSQTIKGGDTEDNTEVQNSQLHCKTTRDPIFGTNFENICLEPI